MLIWLHPQVNTTKLELKITSYTENCGPNNTKYTSCNKEQNNQTIHAHNQQGSHEQKLQVTTV